MDAPDQPWLNLCPLPMHVERANHSIRPGAKGYALGGQESGDCAEHLPEKLVWCWCSGEHIQAVGQCLHLAADDLLRSTQSLLSTITFNRNPYEVRCQLDQTEILRRGSSRFAIVHAEGSQDFSFRREYWIRPGSLQPVLQRCSAMLRHVP